MIFNKKFKDKKLKEYLKIFKKAKSLKIYKLHSEAKDLFRAAVKLAYKTAIKFDDKREFNEDKIVELFNVFGKNEKYIALKNKGADTLIEYGIKAGIVLAEGYFQTDINIPEEIIDKIADKGGDLFVKIFDKLIARLKKLLNRKSKAYEKRHAKANLN